ncbi:DUF3224 domain-containing protein [Paludisphaera sp.]|uniref:DUF3224 domain-containing protein n=1 Tax=Paludisphaera sp. TaxID=2017432 RepID=UPI00301B88AE
MPTRIRGEFEVTLTTHEPGEAAREAGLPAAVDREAQSRRVGRGEMLMERVTGTLAGRSGSFAIQHQGVMDRGAPSLSITVVPDSGAGELAGITGRMGITIEEGRHFHDFEYDIPDASQED